MPRVGNEAVKAPLAFCVVNDRMISCDAPFVPMLQSEAAARALRLLGRDARLRTLPCGTRAVTVRCALPLGVGLRMTTRGPIFAATACDDSRADAIRALGLHLVNAPDETFGTALRATGFRRVMTPATVALLPTRATLPEQLGLACPEWRGAARQGLESAAGLSMRRFVPSRDRWLLDRERLQQGTKGYRAADADLALALTQSAPEDVWIAMAELHGRPIAGMLFVRHETGATYHVGWTGAEGRRLRAHPALLALAATRLHAAGVRWIELGTLDTERLAGLARFKLGTGARAQRLGGTWIRLPI